MPLRAIVVDMDGTITRFNLDYMNARRKALLELERLSLRTADMNEQVSVYAVLKMLKERLDSEAFKTIRSTLYGILEEMETTAANEVILYPGAVETLMKLRERQLKIGVVTNNGRKGTQLTLTRLGLNGLFDATVTRDDHEEMKPDPGPVRKVLELMRVKPDDAVFVGDGVMDVLAARAAGLRSVAVATGPFNMDRLLQAEPDYLLGSINDLPDLIDRLEKA